MTTEWEKIANETVLKAQKVKCEFSDYVAGLRLIVETLQNLLESAEAELEKKERES